jgi:hypothetical protein
MWMHGINTIRTEGFVGFKTVDELQSSSLAEVPPKPGVYLVLRLADQPPTFRQVSTGGFFKKKDPTVPIADLQARWVADTPIMYIGKAGGGDSGATLQGRIAQLLDFGAGKPVGHYGGRFLWQLADSRALTICWKILSDDDPRAVEKAMIQDFGTVFGRRPFANING